MHRQRQREGKGGGKRERQWGLIPPGRGAQTTPQGLVQGLLGSPGAPGHKSHPSSWEQTGQRCREGTGVLGAAGPLLGRSGRPHPVCGGGRTRGPQRRFRKRPGAPGLGGLSRHPSR